MFKSVLQRFPKVSTLGRVIPVNFKHTISNNTGATSLRNSISPSRFQLSLPSVSSTRSLYVYINRPANMSTEEKPAITLYTTNTPNGIKISIALEELGLPYTALAIELTKNTQKEPWFLEINPNGRIPAITDTSFPDGKPIHVFESGAILQYLASRYDSDHKISYPYGSREHWETQQWLFFQNAGVGPMQGQLNHFHRYAPVKLDYAIERYYNETRRLYSVLEERLKRDGGKHEFLVGDKVTIADISTYGWVRSSVWAGVDLDEFPYLKKWEERLGQREAFIKGRNVPTKARDFKEFTKEELEKQAEEARKWILDGVKADREKLEAAKKHTA